MGQLPKFNTENEDPSLLLNQLSATKTIEESQLLTIDSKEALYEALTDQKDKALQLVFYIHQVKPQTNENKRAFLERILPHCGDTRETC